MNRPGKSKVVILVLTLVEERPPHTKQRPQRAFSWPSMALGPQAKTAFRLCQIFVLFIGKCLFENKHKKIAQISTITKRATFTEAV